MMNERAAYHGMTKSNFAVAHGMHNDNNYSTALDIGIISCKMMQKPKFMEIVKQISHQTFSSVYPEHVYKWENTNQLLKETGYTYTGLKTGITPSAGPCLAASCKKDDYHVVVVVL
jgi:D-alanyl-D-alanine carboxypeptidase